jgi:hypothetical protein
MNPDISEAVIITSNIRRIVKKCVNEKSVIIITPGIVVSTTTVISAKLYSVIDGPKDRIIG